MGTWSHAILGNDTSAEVAEYFKRMYSYQEGGEYKWSVEQITDSLYTEYYDTIKDMPSEKCAVIFALALSLWKKGELPGKLKEDVRRLIYDKIDYNAWKELDATEKLLKQRWDATVDFYESLQAPYDKISKREIKRNKVSWFHAGDCLAIKYLDYYYGIIITDDGRNVDDGSNDLTFVDIKSSSIPTLDDFKNSNLLQNEDIIKFFGGIDAALPDNSNVVFTIKFKKSGMKSLEKAAINIGRLPLTRTFFASSSIRFAQFESKYKTAEVMIKDALTFWSDHQWKPSTYQLAFECRIKFDRSMLKEDELILGESKFKLRDIEASIENSLWHIDVKIRVKNATAAGIEKCWSGFVSVFEYLTGREVNNFSIADDAADDLAPFSEIDFSKHTMKNVWDSKIV